MSDQLRFTEDGAGVEEDIVYNNHRYAVVVLYTFEVKNNVLVSNDAAYGIRNIDTGVIEAILPQLPGSILMSDELARGLDELDARDVGDLDEEDDTGDTGPTAH